MSSQTTFSKLPWFWNLEYSIIIALKISVMRNFIIFISSMILSASGHLATDIYLASMPAMVDYFATSATLVQLTLSSYMISFCLTPLFIGPISDRIGRKQPIVLGIYIGMIATLLCTFSNNIYLLIISRFFQGIGLGMVVSVGRAILPDHFQGRELAKYFSYIAMCMPLLLAMGPPIGGMIQDYGSWQMVFGALFGYLVFLLIFVSFVIKQKPIPSTGSSEPINLAMYFNSYAAIIKNKKFMLYTGFSILMFVGIASYLTLSSFLFQDLLGLTATEYGFTCLMTCSITAVCGFFNSWLINIFKPRTILLIVNPFILFSGLSLCLLQVLDLLNTYTMLGALMLFFATVPASFANAGSLALSNVKGNFGAATALIICLQFLGGGLSSMIISYSSLPGVIMLGTTFLCIGLGCLALLYITSERSEHAISPEEVLQ